MMLLTLTMDADWKTSVMPKSTAVLEPSFDDLQTLLTQHVALMPKTSVEESYCEK